MDENKKKMIFYVGLAGCFLWSAVLMVTAPMTPILAGIRDLQGKLKFSKSDFASKEMVLWTIVIFAAVLLAISIGSIGGCRNCTSASAFPAGCCSYRFPSECIQRTSIGNFLWKSLPETVPKP